MLDRLDALGRRPHRRCARNARPVSIARIVADSGDLGLEQLHAFEQPGLVLRIVAELDQGVDVAAIAGLPAVRLGILLPVLNRKSRAVLRSFMPFRKALLSKLAGLKPR